MGGSNCAGCATAPKSLFRAVCNCRQVNLPDSRQDLLTGGGPFLQNLTDLATESSAIIRGQIACGEHHDGQNPPAITGTHLLQKLEPVDLRHHQIKQHQAGLFPVQSIQSRPAVDRFGYRPPLLLEHRAEKFPLFGIVVHDEDPLRARLRKSSC